MNIDLEDRIVLALDVDSIGDAERLVNLLKDKVNWFKVGSVPFTLMGVELVKLLKRAGKKIFLDLKWHDIPNTVRLAAYHAAMQGVDMVSVHSLGGKEMVAAALEGVLRAQKELGSSVRCKVIGITLLTSMGILELDDYQKIFGVAEPYWSKDPDKGEPSVAEVILKTVERIAESVAEVEVDGEGIDGYVCSAWEVGFIRKRFPKKRLITPGIRLGFIESDDQSRAMHPMSAIAMEADQLVVGRPILNAPDPIKAVEQLQAEVKTALHS